MILLVFSAWAFAPVVEKLPGGEIDWTRQVLKAGASGAPTGGMGVIYEILEEDAQTRLGPMFLELSRRVQVTPTQTTGDLLEAENQLADRIDDNLSGWGVEEARYFASGRVELDGTLSIPYLLRPALLAGAKGHEREGPPTLAVTGVIVDARGFVLRPSFAPVLTAVDGTRIFELATLTTSAPSPCVWVTDPADPVGVARGGDTPIFLRAVGVKDGEVVLSDEGVAALRVAAAGAPFLAHGQVVLVVDP